MISHPAIKPHAHTSKRPHNFPLHKRVLYWCYFDRFWTVSLEAHLCRCGQPLSAKRWRP